MTACRGELSVKQRCIETTLTLHIQIEINFNLISNKLQVANVSRYEKASRDKL